MDRGAGLSSNRVIACSTTRRWGQFVSRLSCAFRLGAALAASLAMGASAESLNADQLKAAYLFNFARYVEWPSEAHDSPKSSLRIGVVGSSAVSALLKKTVKGKSVGPRNLEVSELDAPAQGREHHILFVAGTLSPDEREDVLAELDGTPVFVVADDDSFAKRGGIANFFVADQRVRFAINKSAAERAGLKVSSKLLRLAELVE